MSKEQGREKLEELMNKLLELYDKTNEPELKINIALCIVTVYKAVFNY